MNLFGAAIAVVLGATALAGGANAHEMTAVEMVAAVEVSEGRIMDMKFLEEADIALAAESVMTKMEENGDIFFSQDGGKTWLTQEEFLKKNPDAEFQAFGDEEMVISYSVEAVKDGEVMIYSVREGIQ